MANQSDSRPETSALWAHELAPVTERFAQRLFDSVTGQTTKSRGALSRRDSLPTPSTESNRSLSREPYLRKPEPKTAEQMRAWLFR